MYNSNYCSQYEKQKIELNTTRARYPRRTMETRRESTAGDLK